ncbi:magnesium-translocating P-type ATPase [Croceicoccus ponticola]|uniref:Magnesium-transporting ATPase, P-type 1 n=1 Tax=Croceicoccus ponticola TaxID=2217664 RepID=A0A437GZH4_9SPHN|nr:magnesium-translocating P-type ATPase [Croceicoccus ponticola]RVQ68766.1 magnesium-translocating P-type ATPase [Croceicoccus ponticola]
MTVPWSQTAQEALEALQSRNEGLHEAEATGRLAIQGPNRLRDGDKRQWSALLARQFASPLALILIFGALISLALSDWLDAAIILAILAGSGLLSFGQEYRAGKAVAALRARLALQVRVLRAGMERRVGAETLVPGDIVLLAAGNLVPADGLVLEVRDCQVTEASLTGESLPVEKATGVLPVQTPIARRTNMLFMGSSLRSGTAKMLVTSTGRKTEFGAIAEQLRKAEPESEFARGIRRFGAMLLSVMLVIVLAVLGANQLLGRPPVESLLFSVALAVGISPEMLPAIISVTLAKGARNLARGGVIVRRLDAIENLGSIDVLCTDKTGTLTEGAIRLDAAVDASGQVSSMVERAGFLNAALETGIANPLDAAIVAAGEARGAQVDPAIKIDEIPYDFLRRRLSIVVSEPDADHVRMITKGAFADVLSACTLVQHEHGVKPLDGAEREALEAMLRERGSAGYRALAVAERRLSRRDRYSRDDEREMIFLGLLLFFDPPKPEAMQAVHDLQSLGISVKMISGDNRYVAAHVAEAVGLDPKRLMTGEAVAKMSAEALCRRAGEIAIFAETDPQQKERIIRALQQAGHAVGYMGDGINDAPALHLADVGISVDQAVDVARESADVVLLRRDLDILRQGVVDGRRTFTNTLKYIAITVSANFGNMVSMAIATPLLPFLPLLAKQILLNNFMSDLPSLAISTDNVDPESVAAPQRWDIGKIRRFMIVFGLVSSIFDLLTFAVLLLSFKADPTTFRTAWFLVSLLTELAVLFLLRTRRFVLASRPSRLLLWSSVAVAFVTLTLPYVPLAQEAFSLTPLTPLLLGFCVAVTIAYAFATEVAKFFLAKSADRNWPHKGA